MSRYRLIAAFVPVLFFQQAPGPPVPRPDLAKSGVQLLETDKSAGLELWRTRLGDFWIPSPGRHVIAHLEWEALDQKVYDHPSAHVMKGDVVLDCGAHIGYFTRLALRAGARSVIAVEPEPANIAAFRRNLAAELESGRVKLVSRGVWHARGKLPLKLSGSSNDAHSLVGQGDGKGERVIDLIPIDELAAELGPVRIDFIKMDIEGAETNALRGAQGTLRRWRPRLAISAYHLKEDPANIARIVWTARPDYFIASKDIIGVPHGPLPKVLFFY